MDETLFPKILIAILNPANGCFAPDGDVLTVVPRRSIPVRDGQRHFFVSTRDQTLKARYGWVEERSPFTLDSFIEQHYGEAALTSDEREHLDIMLRSIQRVPAAADGKHSH